MVDSAPVSSFGQAKQSCINSIKAKMNNTTAQGAVKQDLNNQKDELNRKRKSLIKLQVLLLR